MMPEASKQQDNPKYKPHTIGWEKWYDPYGENIDDMEWPGYNEQAGTDDDDYLSQEMKQFNPLSQFQPPQGFSKPVPCLATSLGPIPITEQSSPSKVFNFWMGNTNFNITGDVADIINKTAGVEILSIFTRYRFRVGIGKMFDVIEVRLAINKALAAYLERRKPNGSQNN